MTENISDIANQAADTIEKHGLAKFTLKDPMEGSYCARGAIMHVITHETDFGSLAYSGWRHPDFWVVDDAFSEFVGEDTAEWNNADDRTQDEVVQAFRDLAIKHQPDSL